MNTNTKLTPAVGLLLFSAGILLGALLAGGLVWADLEAVFYGLPHLTNETFGGLSCPPLMTRSETASLRVTVRNDADRPIAPLVRVELSAPGFLPSTREKTPLIQPGERVILDFPVSEENIDLEFFIFAKAFRYPDYQTQLAEDTCGILVLDVPFLNGGTLLALWLGLSLSCTLAGLWILEKQESIVTHRASMLVGLRGMSVALLLGMILAIREAWLPGIAMLVIMLLFVIVLLYLLFAY